jgi:disulfide bond formation protein DsbB
MIKIRLFAIISFLFAAGAILIAACGAPATPEGPKGDAVAGKTKYEGTCIACHGPDAKGIAGLGKDLTVSEFAKGKSDADLVALVLIGRDTGDPANTTGVAMPPKGGNPALTDQDLLDIVAYVRTLEK